MESFTKLCDKDSVIAFNLLCTYTNKIDLQSGFTVEAQGKRKFVI